MPLEVRGTFWALTTVAVWAGWVVATRYAVIDSSLNAFDLVAICYGVSGLLFLPMLLTRLSRRELPRPTVQLGIFLGYGAPFRLVATAGFIFAPASHGAALTPGVLPFFAAAYAVLLFGERLTRQGILGLALILAGVAMIGGHGLWFAPGTQRIGHALFLFGSFLLATYGAVLQRSKVSALDGAMICAVYSMLIYCPIYFGVRGLYILSVAWPARDQILQPSRLIRQAHVLGPDDSWEEGDDHAVSFCESRRTGRSLLISGLARVSNDLDAFGIVGRFGGRSAGFVVAALNAASATSREVVVLRVLSAGILCPRARTSLATRAGLYIIEFDG
jgi:drug/metabolite transporter (DMT)-like permease